MESTRSHAFGVFGSTDLKHPHPAAQLLWCPDYCRFRGGPDAIAQNLGFQNLARAEIGLAQLPLAARCMTTSSHQARTPPNAVFQIINRMIFTGFGMPVSWSRGCASLRQGMPRHADSKFECPHFLLVSKFGVRTPSKTTIVLVKKMMF